MNFEQSESSPDGKKSVFEGVTPYHWLVFLIAAGAWMFDCAGQRIFILAREPAIRDLLGGGAADVEVHKWGAWATAIMMVGWATGGIFFGMMSDRVGRVKTIVASLLAYTIFSGLTGLSRTPGEFLAYRFLGGLGIGGIFGASTTLLAESVPMRVRALALGIMQTLSALGNICGSLLSRVVQPGKADFYHGCAGWRIIFLVGTLPAVLAVVIPFVLREPESWKQVKAQAQAGKISAKFGSFSELFQHPVWRRNLLVGVALGLSGMAGLWGIGFFSPELIATALKGEPQNVVDVVKAYGLTFQDAGAFLGMLSFTFAATYLGRRKAFLGAFALCLVTTIFVFNGLRSGADAYWMLPIMGFAQLSVFGGYSIYFPELFPTRLRGTGVSFCYNTVRYLAAGFPIMLSGLNGWLSNIGVQEPFRKAAMILSLIFVLGPIALIWAPETKGKPLPE